MNASISKRLTRVDGSQNIRFGCSSSAYRHRQTGSRGSDRPTDESVGRVGTTPQAISPSVSRTITALRNTAPTSKSASRRNLKRLAHD